MNEKQAASKNINDILKQLDIQDILDARLDWELLDIIITENGISHKKNDGNFNINVDSKISQSILSDLAKNLATYNGFSLSKGFVDGLIPSGERATVYSSPNEIKQLCIRANPSFSYDLRSELASLLYFSCCASNSLDTSEKSISKQILAVIHNLSRLALIMEDYNGLISASQKVKHVVGLVDDLEKSGIEIHNCDLDRTVAALESIENKIQKHLERVASSN